MEEKKEPLKPEQVLPEEELRLIVQAFINTTIWERYCCNIDEYAAAIRPSLSVDGVMEKLKPLIEKNKEMFWQDAKFLSYCLKSDKDRRNRILRDIEKGLIFGPIELSFAPFIDNILEAVTLSVGKQLDKSELKKNLYPQDIYCHRIAEEYDKIIQDKKDIAEIIIANPHILFGEGSTAEKLSNILGIPKGIEPKDLISTLYKKIMELFLSDNSKFAEVVNILARCEVDRFTNTPKNTDLYPAKKGYNVANWTRELAFSRIQNIKAKLAKSELPERAEYKEKTVLSTEKLKLIVQAFINTDIWSKCDVDLELRSTLTVDRLMAEVEYIFSRKKQGFLDVKKMFFDSAMFLFNCLQSDADQRSQILDSVHKGDRSVIPFIDDMYETVRLSLGRVPYELDNGLNLWDQYCSQIIKEYDKIIQDKKDIAEIIIANPHILFGEGSTAASLHRILGIPEGIKPKYVISIFYKTTMELLLNNHSKFAEVVNILATCKVDRFTNTPKNIDLYPEEKGYNVAKWTRGVAFKRIEEIKAKLATVAHPAEPDKTLKSLGGEEYKGKH